LVFWQMTVCPSLVIAPPHPHPHPTLGRPGWWAGQRDVRARPLGMRGKGTCVTERMVGRLWWRATPRSSRSLGRSTAAPASRQHPRARKVTSVTRPPSVRPSSVLRHTCADICPCLRYPRYCSLLHPAEVLQPIAAYCILQRYCSLLQPIASCRGIAAYCSLLHPAEVLQPIAAYCILQRYCSLLHPAEVLQPWVFMAWRHGTGCQDSPAGFTLYGSARYSRAPHTAHTSAAVPYGVCYPLTLVTRPIIALLFLHGLI
jgi:hypothetical protein